MRQANRHITQASIRFSKWSRKSWAVFNSLGREVSIGHLNVPVVGQALKKTLLGSSTLIAGKESDDRFETEENFGDELLLTDWVNVLMMVLLTVNITLELPSPGGKLFLHNILTGHPSSMDDGIYIAASYRWPDVVLSLIKCF